jgi:nitrous oxidase accessory protein
VVLIGEPGAVLDGEGKGTVVTVDADSVEIRGFRLRHAGRSLTDDQAAVKLLRCIGCRVVGNRITEPLHGIYLLESADVEVIGNRIEGDASLPEARRGNGIHLFHSGGARIAGNTIRGTRDGIYFGFSSGNEITDNDVARVRYGLHYMYSDDNRFERNRFTRNAAGAAIMFSSRILFRENVFSDHVGYRAYGILLQTAYEVTAERNRIEGNLIGVFLDMSERNTFRENSISGNGIGVDLIASAEGNTFVANAITRNRTAVRRPNGTAENVWAVDGRGNYWGDDAVFDLDGDGVGDRPYRASDPFASLAGMRPVLEIFSGTPAAAALSWAERAFPVFDLPAVEDPFPLIDPPAGAPLGHALRTRSR